MGQGSRVGFRAPTFPSSRKRGALSGKVMDSHVTEWSDRIQGEALEVSGLPQEGVGAASYCCPDLLLRLYHLSWEATSDL